MSGMLYVVGTPIGNLGDITLRALETLKKVDFIAAEDTRVTRGLLTHFDIQKPLVSYYEHNRIEAGERILSRLLAGESCALVTDAGMPAVSDPGRELVSLCAENGVELTVIPGPCAAVAAVALSGMDTSRFCFEGFLSVNKKARRERLDEIRTERRAMIFYEAPHKLTATLADLAACFGGERHIALCREMTKLHEETLRMTLEQAVDHFSENQPRGEFVLVVEGAKEPEKQPVTLDEAVAMAEKYLDEGSGSSDAAKRAAGQTGFPKGAIYRELTRRRETL